MLNDFERRALDLAENAKFLANIQKNGRKIIAIDPFSYNVSLASVAAPVLPGATAQGFTQIQSDSDFVIQYMSAKLLGTEQVTCQITDTGSGRTFFNEPTLVTLAFGDRGFPFLLPTPRVVAPSTNVKVDIRNISAATNLTGAYFSFIGSRIYYAG